MNLTRFYQKKSSGADQLLICFSSETLQRVITDCTELSLSFDPNDHDRAVQKLTNDCNALLLELFG